MGALFARFRNHIVTGFIFLMPVLITLVIVGRFWKHLLAVGGKLCHVLRIDTIFGPPGDAVAAILFFIFVCIVAGFLIRISFLRKLSEQIDAQLERAFPGYTQIRTETTKKIGGSKNKGEQVYEACLVQVQELWRPGYIIDTNDDGTLTVFVPQAPDPTNGQIYVVEPGRVRKLDVDSEVLKARLKKMGKGILASKSA